MPRRLFIIYLVMQRFKRYVFYTLSALLIFGLILSITLTYKNTGAIKFIESKPIEREFTKSYAYISGEVLKPGVYEIGEQTRLVELIERAGGFTENADSYYISEKMNLSQVIKNEDSFFIPSIKIEDNNLNVKSDKVNINSSTEAELQTLPGIGESTAKKIIENRPYNQIEDLLNVPGIGELKLKQIEDIISI